MKRNLMLPSLFIGAIALMTLSYFSGHLRLLIITLLLIALEIMFLFSQCVLINSGFKNQKEQYTQRLWKIRILILWSCSRLILPIILVLIFDDQKFLIALKQIVLDQSLLIYKLKAYSSEISAFAGIIMILISLKYIVLKFQNLISSKHISHWIMKFNGILWVPVLIAVVISGIFISFVPSFYKHNIINAFFLGFIIYGLMIAFDLLIEYKNNNRAFINKTVEFVPGSFLGGLTYIATLSVIFSINSIAVVSSIKISFMIYVLIMLIGLICVWAFLKQNLQNTNFLNDTHLVNCTYILLGILGISLCFNVTTTKFAPLLISILMITYFVFHTKIHQILKKQF